MYFVIATEFTTLIPNCMAVLRTSDLYSINLKVSVKCTDDVDIKSIRVPNTKKRKFKTEQTFLFAVDNTVGGGVVKFFNVETHKCDMETNAIIDHPANFFVWRPCILQFVTQKPTSDGTIQLYAASSTSKSTATSILLITFGNKQPCMTLVAGAHTVSSDFVNGRLPIVCKNGIGSSARFSDIRQMICSRDGNRLYLTDCLVNRLRMIDLKTFSVTTIAGNGFDDYLDEAETFIDVTDEVVKNPNFIDPLTIALNTPTAITFDCTTIVPDSVIYMCANTLYRVQLPVSASDIMKYFFDSIGIPKELWLLRDIWLVVSEYCSHVCWLNDLEDFVCPSPRQLDNDFSGRQSIVMTPSGMIIIQSQERIYSIDSRFHNDEKVLYRVNDETWNLYNMILDISQQCLYLSGFDGSGKGIVRIALPPSYFVPRINSIL